MNELETATLEISTHLTEKSRLPEIDFQNLNFGRVFSDHVFLADYQNGSWQNLRIQPYETLPRLTPANACLHYGQSVFEGLKAYTNTEKEVILFRADENWKRLNKSAVRMCIPQIPKEIYKEGMRMLLDMDRGWIPPMDGASLYIRPLIYAKDNSLGVRPSDTYQFVILTGPVGAYYGEPVKVKVETHFSRACEGGMGAAKSAGNYAGSLYPAQLGLEEGYHQLLWTDSKEHKYIEEAGTMNVMFLIGNQLITAESGSTILDGITRKSVLELAREWGVDVQERKLAVSELIESLENGTFVEAFGTGTAATIAPICQIGYEGKNYDLPTVAKDALSNRLLTELEDIRRGRKADTKGWIWKF